MEFTSQSGLTSLPIKIIEQILLKTLLRLTENKKVVCDIQHVSSKGKSCLTNVIAFYSGVTVHLKSSEFFQLLLEVNFERILVYPEHVANFHTRNQDIGLYFSTMNEAQAIFTFSKQFKERKTCTPQ